MLWTRLRGPDAYLWICLTTIVGGFSFDWCLLVFKIDVTGAKCFLVSHDDGLNLNSLNFRFIQTVDVSA